MGKMNFFINPLKLGCGIAFLFCLLLFFSLMFDKDSKNLGANFTYDAEHNHILGEIDIPPTVISYDHNKHFIIVKQKPTEFQNIIYDKIEYVYPLGRDTIYYWIIMKKEKKVIGPLDEKQFNDLKEKYNVPYSLVFK
ncbi:MAG: hypothetical protein K9H26_06670 [Prolixibacteraceae bacterium]|nr:hypothetical protein [Prolixibacteraceae bacterium]